MNRQQTKLDDKIRDWLLRTHPEEKPLIGDFRKDVTWREVAKRMLSGECFYDICDCGESVQRELAFSELARLFGTDYEFWYLCWLHDGQGLDEKTKARVLAQIEAEQ